MMTLVLVLFLTTKTITAQTIPRISTTVMHTKIAAVRVLSLSDGDYTAPTFGYKQVLYFYSFIH